MYNYFQVIGRILSEPDIKDVGGKKVVNLLVGVQRSFKNMNGEYDYDTIKVSMWEFLADYAHDTFKKGKSVGLKGRIVPIEVEIGDGKKAIYHNLTAERVIYYDYGSSKEFPTVESTEEES